MRAGAEGIHGSPFHQASEQRQVFPILLEIRSLGRLQGHGDSPETPVVHQQARKIFSVRDCLCPQQSKSPVLLKMGIKGHGLLDAQALH